MKKYPIAAKVFQYVLVQKRLTGRALASILKIHHSTLQRYLKGQRQPTPVVKQRMAKLMQVGSFKELVTKAFYC
ncbi:MAG: helix-turn-helix transcriptional regulator [Flavobacteriales bacterium]